ncbi:hypothetical protein PG994_014879 [Apiospora phragmitis]|uniref:Uncharacterized protein n=1 Tax=Apiospora phragmitis TaxID=2905665 RepID=A0ABR1SUV8_9PEZI
MSSTSPSFGSNNPFRRKTGGPSPSSAAIPSGSPAPSASLDNPTLSSAPRPPVTTFSTAVPEHQDRRDDPIQTKPKKIVKKVRVQSPPPSSPEDAVPVTTYFPPTDYDDDDDDEPNDADSRNAIDTGVVVDPFSGGQTDEEPSEETSDEHALPRAPPNPFSRTLGDLEQSINGEEANSAPGSKGALDVNSFKRLLLTGGVAGHKQSAYGPAEPAILDIRREQTASASPTRTPADEQTESPFDREAAGKLPEAFSEAAANSGPFKSSDGTRSRSESQVSTGTTSSARKPAAPPPRRHGRSDSKPPSIMANPADEEAPRSSMESNRSRAESLRINSNANASLAAPVPPPPRRPSHNRSGSSITSPTSASSPGSIDGVRLSQGTGFSLLEHPNYGSGMATVTTTKDGVPKLSPPPPPPARHSSARRPPSISSLESGSRKVSREKDGAIAAPPPPPRRSRSNKSNMETAEGIRGGSGSRSATGGLKQVDGEPPKSLATSEATSIGTGVDILKDLEALQNEVKAAMSRS